MFDLESLKNNFAIKIRSVKNPVGVIIDSFKRHMFAAF